jgi:glycosyltransferase involved in cell wall biosynthesis
MAEALASATPVLTFPFGAAPEIVTHGKTGFLCRDEADMVTAIDRIAQIDRGDCRAAAEQRFSMERMAREHERLYRRVLEDRSELGARHASRHHHSLQIRKGNGATLTL